MANPVPAEWAPHRAMWLGFPSHAELWEDDLAPAQAEVAALARALAGPGGERVRLLTCGEAAAEAARGLLLGRRRRGDRARRPSATSGCATPARSSPRRARRPASASTAGAASTSWTATTAVADQIAAAAGAPLTRHRLRARRAARWITTAPARCSPPASACSTPTATPAGAEADAEAALAEALGARKVLWLGEGLLNDHTDGHVDNLARFVAPGRGGLPGRLRPRRPQRGRLRRRRRAAGRHAPTPTGAPPAGGAHPLARPDRWTTNGAVAPASHMNFLIANGAVIVPTYDEPRRRLARRGAANACSPTAR